MEKPKELFALILTFLIALGFRLAFVFRVPFFSSDSAYFNLRHSEHIAQNFLPIINDPLSYGGNIIVNTHLFHYFLALWDQVFSQAIVYKIIPAILASSIVIIVYLFAKQITKNHYAAIFGALLAAFVPTYISNTINQISVVSVYIPVFLLLLAALLTVNKRRTLFLVLALILILLDPLNLLMIFTLIIFVVLLIAESVDIKRQEREAMGFFVVLFLLVNIVIFRTLYFDQGLATVWQNLPLELYGQLFQDFNLFNTISLIGVVPLVFGIAGFMISSAKDKSISLLKAALLADFTLLLLKLIPFEEGILILAVILCITSAISLSSLITYFKITKISSYTPYLTGLIVLLSVVSLAIPSAGFALEVVDNGVTQGEIEALQWIDENTAKRSVIVGNVNEGNLIIYIANRQNVIDTHFFRAENRILDVETIYTSESLVLAKRALDNYGIDYIYFSEKSKEFYKVDSLAYAKDEACFEEVFKNEQATVYEVVC